LITPVQALSLQSGFSPPPEQLDDDPILEYILKPGQRLNVDYEINPFDIVPVQLGGWGNYLYMLIRLDSFWNMIA
jgi:hypothetical protein